MENIVIVTNETASDKLYLPQAFFYLTPLFLLSKFKNHKLTKKIL